MGLKVFGPEPKEDFILRMVRIDQKLGEMVQPRVELRKNITVTELSREIIQIKKTTMYTYIVYERIGDDSALLVSELDAAGF